MNNFRVQLSKIADIEVCDEPLSARTTLHIGGRPIATVQCASEAAFVQAVRLCEEYGVEPVIVGGGSNVLIADGELPFVAVVLANSEISIEGSVVRAGAGAEWDAVVRQSIEAGLGGLECLSGIPGSAGAVPVQNVGAYGVEVSQLLRRVRIFDRVTGECAWVDPAALDLSYRHSRLKFQSREIVTAIELQCDRTGLSVPIRFGELARRLGAEGMERFDAPAVRRAVLELRRAKGMVYDEADHDTWSAGSFFTNPVVEASVAERVCERAVEQSLGDVPRYPVEGSTMVKLSAAWLIEKAGFPKGFGLNDRARLSSRHTLALTNRGGASAEDIIALAKHIQEGVKVYFGVDLHPEPVCIGCEI